MHDHREFTDGVYEALLWAERDDNGTPLDQNYTVDDIAAPTKRAIETATMQFLTACHETVFWHETNAIRAGIDYWLTIAGHGAGYWDGDYGTDGDVLTQIARDSWPHGDAEVYVGDDRKIYVFGTENS